MSTPTRRSFVARRGALLLLPLLGACADSDLACTEIGCSSQLDLAVTGTPDLGRVSGQVTVGGHTFAVDCAGTSDPEVTCGEAGITISLADGEGGGTVEWTLSTPDDDTATGGGSYVGNGTLTPDWSESTPNGANCPPVCVTATATVELFGTP